MTTAEQTYTSLLNPLAFPPFVSCPHDRTFSPIYYRQRGFAPVRHWCFLGEIEDISGIGRLCLDVKDREGTAVRIYDYLDRLDPAVISAVIPAEIKYPQHPNFPRHLIQEGNTIAVLYAQQHPWREEPLTGIRIEDGDMVQIFPCSLNKLLSLSDQILQDALQSKAPESRACDKCGEKAASLLRCSACRLAWYCSRDCQIADWSGEGHKKDCKLARQVKLLMKQTWGHFETHFKFPLSDEP